MNRKITTLAFALTAAVGALAFSVEFGRRPRRARRRVRPGRWWRRDDARDSRTEVHHSGPVRHRHTVSERVLPAKAELRAASGICVRSQKEWRNAGSYDARFKLPSAAFATSAAMRSASAPRRRCSMTCRHFCDAGKIAFQNRTCPIASAPRERIVTVSRWSGKRIDV